MAVVGSTRGPGAAPPGPGMIVATPHGLGVAGTAPFRPDAGVADPCGPRAPAASTGAAQARDLSVGRAHPLRIALASRCQPRAPSPGTLSPAAGPQGRTSAAARRPPARLGRSAPPKHRHGCHGSVLPEEEEGPICRTIFSKIIDRSLVK
jgi:hypothetical protein